MTFSAKRINRATIWRVHPYGFRDKLWDVRPDGYIEDFNN